MKARNFKHLRQGLFLLFCLITVQLQAQQDTVAYIPIPDNAVWSINSLKFKTFGDTVINSKDYIKVYWQDESSPYEFDINKASYFCALRNDTAAKRVYGVYKEATEVVYVYRSGNTTKYNSTDTSEFLLYDFSLKVGDSVWAAAFFEYDSPYKIMMYQYTSVLNSDSIIILNDSSYRKKIFMKIILPYEPDNQYWIEGIGSSNGIFTPATNLRLGTELPIRRLLCFAVNDEILIKFPEYDYDSIPDDCYSIGDISNIHEYGVDFNIKLYPNPVENIVTLEMLSTDIIFPYTITILDLLGKELQTVVTKDKQTNIDLTNLNKGLYIIKILKINKFYKIIKN